MKSTLVSAAVVVGLTSGCSGENERFFIVQNQVPTAGCVVNTTRTLYRGEGTLDVALVSGNASFAYQLFPLLQNDYPAVGMANASEPNRLFVRAFRVWVEPGEGAPARLFEVFDKAMQSEQTRALVEFQQPWAATIDPGGGLLAAGVGVVPAELARQIRASQALVGIPSAPIVVRVRAVGKRQDGEVESKEFTYPISVCSECLIGEVRACPYMATNTGNACNVAQDSVVDCCQAGVELTCPATP
jgi:hypothetical protein